MLVAFDYFFFFFEKLKQENWWNDRFWNLEKKCAVGKEEKERILMKIEQKQEQRRRN